METLHRGSNQISFAFTKEENLSPGLWVTGFAQFDSLSRICGELRELHENFILWKTLTAVSPKRGRDYFKSLTCPKALPSLPKHA